MKEAPAPAAGGPPSPGRPGLHTLAILLLGASLVFPGVARAQFDGPVTAREEMPREAIRLAEPAPDEVALVINANAAFGNHAGLFAGPRLSDPAGSYVALRQRQRDWQASLADYVRFQSSDGTHIRVYRFRLEAEAFAAVTARLPEADRAAPLFCATAVHNAVAGIGPFSSLALAGWTSPIRVASLLDRLVAAGAGACELPDASPCPPLEGPAEGAVARGAP